MFASTDLYQGMPSLHLGADITCRTKMREVKGVSHCIDLKKLVLHGAGNRIHLN